MAKTKLKSVFTREDVYTVLQLLKALADGVDTNEELTDADIEKLKASIDKLNGAVNIAEDNTVTIANGIIINPTADVDIVNNLKLNSPDNLTFVTGSLSKTYYQHTVHIHFGGESSQTNICFTALSTSNIPIVSYQDLHTVFGGRDIAVSGFAFYWSPTLEGSKSMTPLYLNLHGGTQDSDKLVGADTSKGYEVSIIDIASNEGAPIFEDDVCPL